MSRGEAEVSAMLAQARRMDHGEAQIALLEDAVRHADAGGLHRLAFLARRSLAGAYSTERQWDKAFPLFSRCLSEYDARPGEFGPEEDWALRGWYASIAQSMAEFPEISLTQINGAFEDMERRFRAGGHSLGQVYDARRWVAQLACDWPEEERRHRQWKAAGGPDPDSVWDFEADVERLVRRGDDASVERALALAGPVLAGEVTFHEPPAPIQCHLLLPLVRAGRLEEAVKAFNRSHRDMCEGHYRYEYCSMQIEFCALTGNEEAGLDILRARLVGYPTLNRPNGKMEFAAAGAILLRRLVADGRGGESVRANGTDLRWSVAELCQEMESTARDLAARFDARNGTTHQGDWIRARLAAAPVVGFLPLFPGARRPVRPPIPTGMPPEAMLDQAEWFERREEYALARRFLAAVGTPPPHLAARHAELTALTGFGRPEAEHHFRRAAEAYRQAGDQRRHLLCMCQLGRWLCEQNRFGEGLGMVAWAAGELRRTGEPGLIAQGAWLHALSLAMAEQKGAYELLDDAVRHAVASGDPVLIGSLALIDGAFREVRRFPPGNVIDLADTARRAFAAADSPGQLVKAYELRRRNHERAGAPHHFTELVERELATLPPAAPAQLRGYLRYRRGLALLHAGRPADALDDLIEGVGEARTRDADTPEQSYQLALAFRAAGRAGEAAEVAEDLAEWLERLRRDGDSSLGDLADRNRLLLAEARQALGHQARALAEYRQVAASARDRHDPGLLLQALMPAAAIQDLLDGNTAATYREAADAATALGDVHTAANCRASEALSLQRSGDVGPALAVLAQAEAMTGALPAEPADRLPRSWAITWRSAAHVLSAAGRLPEAADRAARAAAAFRQVGEPADAARMDLLHARTLIRLDRPDLAEPLLRTLLEAFGHETPLHQSAARALTDLQARHPTHPIP
ncbi:hypothetical protein ABGB18_25790 [Nonomuraea sp. B12E4]|uniref:hypothetical protein n=1 Tax=Nonomuraea sp. B12E4 TaxID=3153564 RepID=UPI00325D7BFC